MDSVAGLRVDGQLEELGHDLRERDNKASPAFLPEDELSLAEV